MTTPKNIVNAMRENIKDAALMFTHGKCYQLFLMLADLYPQAVAWYDPIAGHVYTEIDGKYYDINGEYNELPERSHLFDESLLSSLGDALEWDYPAKVAA